MDEAKQISNITDDSGNGISISKADASRRKYFLKGKVIGISISESENLPELGYGVAHLRDVMIEMARYLAAAGGNLAYGGDLRQGGFTELLFDILLHYKVDKELKPSQRLYSYLAYPISATLSRQKQAELNDRVTFVKVPPPNELEIKDPQEFLPPDSPQNNYIWAKSLTEMREKMESFCNARIFIGGRATGYKGKCPGILEELLVALKHKHPVYLVGAFGGVSKHAFDAIQNHPSEIFLDSYHVADKSYEQTFNLFNSKEEEKIDYSVYFNTLKELGIEGLSKANGLSVKENLRLAETPHINEIVFLIMKGLANCLTN